MFACKKDKRGILGILEVHLEKKKALSTLPIWMCSTRFIMLNGPFFVRVLIRKNVILTCFCYSHLHASLNEFILKISF